MNKLLTTITLLCFSVGANSQQTEEEIKAAIRDTFTANYMNGSAKVDGSNREFSEIFRLPMMFPDLTVAFSVKEIEDWYVVERSQRREGYAYSKANSLDVHKLTEEVYYVYADWSRFNGSDEVIRRFTAAYFYAKDDDSWKIFKLSLGPGYYQQ